MKVYFIVPLLMLPVGCVVFPTTRTYFEPNPEDGTPVPSSSCGYHRASKDSLSRDIQGIHVQVTPIYEKRKPLSAMILFRYVDGHVDVRPSEFQLRVLPNDTVITPAETKVTYYERDNTHPYRKWVYLNYAMAGDDVAGLSFLFPEGTVSRNGDTVKLARFRFEKTTKSDIYYGSINC